MAGEKAAGTMIPLSANAPGYPSIGICKSEDDAKKMTTPPHGAGKVITYAIVGRLLLFPLGDRLLNLE